MDGEVTDFGRGVGHGCWTLPCPWRCGERVEFALVRGLLSVVPCFGGGGVGSGAAGALDAGANRDKFRSGASRRALD